MVMARRNQIKKKRKEKKKKKKGAPANFKTCSKVGKVVEDLWRLRVDLKFTSKKWSMVGRIAIKDPGGRIDGWPACFE